MWRMLALLNGLAAAFCIGMLLLSGKRRGTIVRAAPQQRARSCTRCRLIQAEPDAAQADPSQGQCRLPLAETRLLDGVIVSTVHSGRNCTVPELLARVVEAETASSDCELQRQLLKLAARLGGPGGAVFTLLQDCTHPPCCPALLDSFARDHSHATVFGVTPTADRSPSNLWRMQPARRPEELARRREPLHRLCSGGCVTVQIAHGLQGHPLRAALTAARGAAEAAPSGEARAPRGSSRRLLEWLSRAELQREQEERALSKQQQQLASRLPQQPHGQ